MPDLANSIQSLPLPLHLRWSKIGTNYFGATNVAVAEEARRRTENRSAGICSLPPRIEMLKGDTSPWQSHRARVNQFWERNQNPNRRQSPSKVESVKQSPKISSEESMFGSTHPFGQSSNSPFGSPPVFGQTGSAAAPNPFGSPSPNPFSTHSGGSMFGMSTGVFGQPSPGPAFGASSLPAFGSSSSSFGSSAFGQRPAFGGFGSTPSQPSPFGSTFPQTQPAFGSNTFGSTTPFGATSQPSFGSTSTGFGATTNPAFGATSTPTFGSATTPASGSTSTSLFGSTGSAFGVSSTPTFGSTTTSAFGAPSTFFGSSSTPTFGASSTPAFGSSTATSFGASSTPSFNFGSSPSFGQSSSTFVSTPFGSTPSPFGAQSSAFGAQTTTPTFGSPGFGQSSFGTQQVGSRVVPYSATQDPDATGTQPAGKLESITAMPAYKEKSHEELRWEDYQRGDKGGPNPSGQPASGMSFPSQTPANPFGSTGTFGQPAANPFSAASSSNPFAPTTPAFGSTGFGSSSTSLFSSSFGAPSSSPFGSTSSTPSIFAPSNPGFGSNSSPSLFSGTTSAFGSSPSLFGSSLGGASSSFSSSLTFNTQSSGLFQSSTPSLGQTPSPFGQSTGFQPTTPAFGSNMFNTPSTVFGGSLFSSSTPSLLPTSTPGFVQTTPSLSTPFAPAQTSSAFPFGNFGQTQPASSGGFGGMSNFNQGTFGQPIPSQSNMVMQPAPVTNPFGNLPAMPQMSIGRVGSAPSIQYGISSMPVSEKPTLVRISSMLTPRHLSQRRIRLLPRKYNPKVDGQRVPFFSDDESSTATPKADALFIPRENPRALIIHPIEQWPLRTSTKKQTLLKDNHGSANGNGKISEPSAPVQNENHGRDQDDSRKEDGHAVEQEKTSPSSPSVSRTSQKTNAVPQDNHAERETDTSYITISGHPAGEAADIEALMPKLRHADYYTEPHIQELAAKERSEPGFCCRTKDFVVGRYGYGSIKFLGETDVRRLDLESIVQFNNREVIVYKDENKKPPVGQGLNKPAEVTLLNIKCTNKKTGQHYTEGPKVEKYREMLIKKTEEQGAEFILYDAVKGEWKFRVKHFSRYGVQ